MNPTSRAPSSAALHARHAGLDVPGGVLHDDDGIVHDEAGGYGERHQREVVEREVEQVHRPEGSDQRHRHDHGRNQRRAVAVQEDVDHQDDEGHGQQQRLLDLAQRGANRDGAVEGDHQIDLRVDGALEQRQLGLDGIDHFDDVGARLLKHRDEDRGLAVVQAVGADVLGGAVLHVEDRRATSPSRTVAPLRLAMMRSR